MSIDDLCPEAPSLRHLSLEALTALRDQVHAEIASRRRPVRENVVELRPGDRIRLGGLPVYEEYGDMNGEYVFLGDREDER